jgi:hypothetical protein
VLLMNGARLGPYEVIAPLGAAARGGRPLPSLLTCGDSPLDPTIQIVSSGNYV